MVINLSAVTMVSESPVDDQAHEGTVVVTSTSGRNIRLTLTNFRGPWTDPAQPRTPNVETAEVLRETERGEGIVRYNSVVELIADCERFADAPDS